VNNRTVDYDLFAEACDEIQSSKENLKIYENELKYLEEFIAYMNLEKEYSYFKKHACEVYDENVPFPRLTL